MRVRLPPRPPFFIRAYFLSLFEFLNLISIEQVWPELSQKLFNIASKHILLIKLSFSESEELPNFLIQQVTKKDLDRALKLLEFFVTEGEIRPPRDLVFFLLSKISDKNPQEVFEIINNNPCIKEILRDTAGDLAEAYLSLAQYAFEEKNMSKERDILRKQIKLYQITCIKLCERKSPA